MIDQAGIMMAQGKTISSERILGVNDNMIKSHYHDYFELYYLESGERYHMFHDKLYKIEPGEFIIFPPYVMHYSYGDTDVSFKRLLLYFKKEEIDSPEVLQALENSDGVYRLDSKNRKIIHRALEAFVEEQTNPQKYSSSYMHALLNMTLLSILRQDRAPVKAEKKSRIENVISYIHTNYQQDLTLEILAKRFYVSPYYLCREFKKETNRTIVQYINITRIMNAQSKIMETDKHFTEISSETGFSNITHFNRVFKSVTGITPSQYKKTYLAQKQGSN